MLSNARKQGWKVETLGDLVQRLPTGERLGLEAKLDAVRDAARRLRHESWTQWVVSHRCSQQHADELVSLVAGGGEVDPTYGQRSRFGGHGHDTVSPAMLDAEA